MTTTTTNDGFTAVGRKARRAAKSKEASVIRQMQQTEPQVEIPRLAKLLPIRATRRAAATLTVATGSKRVYAVIDTTARNNMNLQKVGISGLHVRRTMTGGLILEIPGEKNKTMSNNLASRLQELFNPERNQDRFE